MFYFNTYLFIFLYKISILFDTPVSIKHMALYTLYMTLYTLYICLCTLYIYLCKVYCKVYCKVLHHIMTSIGDLLYLLIKKLKSIAPYINSRKFNLFINYLVKILNNKNRYVFVLIYSVITLTFIAYTYLTYLVWFV